MAQQANGTKTTTRHIDGNLYQMRMISCGKESCKTCAAGGHSAVYVDTRNPSGPRWHYVGSHLPQGDPDYQQPTCTNAGCTNELTRAGARFCCARCRVAWHRAQQKGQV